MTVAEEIDVLRKAYGADVLVLGHHYQDSEIVKHCDAVGDSLELSRIAAASTAKRIVFCGVRFMAETADILAHGVAGEDFGREVYQPAPTAGCPMAEMATAEALEAAWKRITAADPKATYIPIVYVNSTAEVKAFCGRHGGSACTSGNGKMVVKHFLDKGCKIFFAPDQHLCTNIMRELGYPQDAVALWRRALSARDTQLTGGLTDEQIRSATLIAWDGCCPIHAGFTNEDIAKARAKYPTARLLIHPEAPSPVTAKADIAGSTKAIIDVIQNAPSGGTYVIGTEDHLVRRLMMTHTDLRIAPIRPIVCEDMGLTTLDDLLETLRDFPASKRVSVEAALIPDARACVERMLALG